MGLDKDADGQPASGNLNSKRVRDSRIDELIGICRGVLADGALVFEEALFLRDWLHRDPTVAETFVGRELDAMLDRALTDGSLSSDGERELVALLLKIIGGTPFHEKAASLSTSLPLDDPPPSIRFADRTFCFTGKFRYGSREVCQQAVVALGASVADHPTKQIDYLVIGAIGSRDWAHTSMGRKIEHAVELREQGCPISIIGESHWVAALDQRHSPKNG